MTDKLDWQDDLGAPTRPCTVQLQGLGLVDVAKGDIDRAWRLGGRAAFDVKALYPRAQVNRFYLGAAEGV